MPNSRFAEQRRVPLPGSERQPFSTEGNPRLPFANPPSKAPQGAPPSDRVTVSVIVRRKTPIDPSRFGPGHQPISREQFDQMHGADPQSIDLVKQFAQEYNLQVEPDLAPGRCTVHLSGSVADMQRAFGTSLESRETNYGRLRVRQGPLTLPEELSGHVTAVLGLDDRPQAKPHFRVAVPKASNVSYTPVQVANFYNIPRTGGAGETIGIIELGGGFVQADIQTYFSGLGLPVPTVTAVSVDGGTNSPGDPNGADGEVMLDIEIAGAVAPGAAMAVYFAPNTDQGFLDAITSAIHDTTHNPGVISISWGGPESSWTQQTLTAMDQACQAAAALGVSITVAAGDNGSTDGVTDGANHVDFPGSSPHVLCCGGTKLQGSGTSISSEVVWNELASNEGATGGGVSNFFPKPTWQANAKVPAPTASAGGRGVPDIAGDADPSTGYSVRVDGQTLVIGGTSAVAPLWAGLITVANATNKGRAGFINPPLYAANESSTFRDITSGNNGAFKAGPGWDACTGLGSPNGPAVISALKSGTPNPAPAPTPTANADAHPDAGTPRRRQTPQAPQPSLTP